MKLLQFYLIGILIVLYANYNKGQLLLEGSANRVTECEGTELRGSCPPNQVIAVKDIQYGTTNCALSSEAPGCCDYDPTDCLIDYTGTAQQAACSGRGLCDDVIIGEEDTSSCGSPYPDLNHYLTMEYYCIPETRIGLITSADLQETGELLYLQNSDYPNAPIRAAVTTALCSVETTSCSSQVNVYFVHFELADGGGSCTDTQNLQVDDKGVTHTYTCSDNTYYTINLKLTSASNYLKVTLNNPDGTNDGKFVIGFAATDSTSPLEVSCPAKEQTICQDCPVLTPPSSGSLSTTDVTTGTSVDVSCNSGHTLFGEVTLDCQTNGTWSAVVGTCLQDCPILTPPSSGSLSTTNVTTGTSVDVSCDSGHTLFGEVTLDCQSNGTWSAEVGTCLQDCPVLTPPSSGSLSTTGVTTGTSVDVSCDSGHTLFGEVTLDCQTNGTWSADVGTCLPGLGDSCSSPDNCSAVADATCINNACTCVDGYIENNNECTAASTGGLGDSCSSPSDCSAVADATCINNVCTCVDGYTESNNGCTIASSGGLGDSCTIPSDCSAVEDATCINNVCACVDGYTESNNACTAASSGGQRGLSIGVIVGIVVGALVFALLFCLVIFCFWKRAQPSQKEERHSVENGAISSKSADNSPNGLPRTKSDDNPLSLTTESPDNEVLLTAQVKEPVRVLETHQEKIDRGRPPLDTVFRPPQFTRCDLNNIHMPERTTPNLIYQDDGGYLSIADTEFRPPQFTPCSFNDIHIPERASPDHMYRDDSAYDSFVESLTPIETT